VEWEKEMEVRVIATLQAKPEFVSAVSDAVHEIMEPSRQELGNLQYDLHRDLEQPGTFVFFERWASAEALEKHNATEHFKQFVSQLDGKLDLLDIKQLKKIA
jgi:quinol monooxygenase YgiN